ncbi:unnamed protein product [Durusdinium trenchii]|uniref:CCHC-type domain-containing protein n=1 Tax=Durusdinium trenchii TaxID=1381693 RepID=A0ABP0KXU4_9DINO
MSAMASSADTTGFKMFSGGLEDAKEYRRWKVWVTNKLLTLSDKVLQAIFSMQAAEGENLKTWISRATELFDRCQRKVNVNFPEEARGWLILHRSGLLSEQKAVILARSLGSLKREDIGRSMRSVYPGYVVSKRRAAGVSLIEDATSVADDNIDPEDEELLEFEQFIAEHQVTGDEPEEAFDEPDVAEALAVSWRERRKEMGQLQRARKFKQAQDVRRSFKVEIEELKRRTKCNKCGAVGHWARECKAAGKGSGKSKSLPVKGKENAAAMVVEETFVALVDCQTTPWLSLHLLRERQARTFSTESEQLLVSSPGFGVLDSGCGRSIIGADTLAEFMELWKTHRTTPPMPFDEVNHFKYGSGQQETSKQAIKVPVILGGCKGTIKAAIVQGQAPLLISRSALKTLKAVINFETNELTVFDSRTVVPLSMNQAGQYTVDLMGSPAETSDSFSEIMLSAPAELSEQPSSTPAAISPSEACEPTPVEDQVPGPEHPKLKRHRQLRPCQCIIYDNWRNRVTSELAQAPPKLLVLCPPCADEGQVSTFAGQYTPQFVHATLNTIPAFRQSTAASLVQCAPCTESQCQEVLMSRNDLQADKSEADICKVLDSLHRNLGHPPAHDLVRILKHANASEKAITLARQFECDICKNQIRPHVALPAKTGRVPGFNEVVGLDVKNLPGWHANQKVKALNIVCHGSCYQMMIPFFQTEATALIRQLFTEHWIRPFGPPKALVIDQARTNMGEALQNHLDLQGTEVRQIAGEAHWQLGRTEVQGGWFSRILTKILAEHLPFEPGALVAYWRHQKFQAGQGVLLGGRWYGTAVVIGLVGRNYIIAHRKHIFRCAPEQLRPATGEERALVQTPQTELLGIRDMIEGGTFRSQNFVDLVPGHYPPEQSSEQQDMSSEAVPDVPAPVESTPELPHASEHQTMDTDNAPETPESEQSEPKRTSSSLDRESGASYGPVRTRSRIHMKSGPAALHVPAHTDAQDDFIDLMKEVVPRLIAEHVSTAPVSENHPNWNPDQDTHEASG